MVLSISSSELRHIFQGHVWWARIKHDSQCRLIGCLIYLTITRSELSYSVHILAQFMQHPRDEHWEAALRVVQYLKSNPGRGILLHSDSALQLIAYYDAEWASCPLIRRSLTVYFCVSCFFSDLLENLEATYCFSFFGQSWISLFGCHNLWAEMAQRIVTYSWY